MEMLIALKKKGVVVHTLRNNLSFEWEFCK